jgi:hypothetical protein
VPHGLRALRFVLEIQRSDDVHPDADDRRVRLCAYRHRHRPLLLPAKLRLPLPGIPGRRRGVSAGVTDAAQIAARLHDRVATVKTGKLL